MGTNEHELMSSSQEGKGGEQREQVYLIDGHGPRVVLDTPITEEQGISHERNIVGTAENVVDIFAVGLGPLHVGTWDIIVVLYGGVCELTDANTGNLASNAGHRHGRRTTYLPSGLKLEVDEALPRVELLQNSPQDVVRIALDVLSITGLATTYPTLGLHSVFENHENRERLRQTNLLSVHACTQRPHGRATLVILGSAVCLCSDTAVCRRRRGPLVARPEGARRPSVGLVGDHVVASHTQSDTILVRMRSY